ncbi:MAG: universal stress protein [Myxococcota bacterium]
MKTYRNILVATDFSPRADVALETAVGLARRSSGRLTLIHVLPPVSRTPSDLSPEAEERMARERLLDMAGMLEPHTEIAVRRGHAAREIARAAALLASDVVVISSQGLGAVQRAILGSVATSLLGLAGCPVMVVGEHRTLPTKITKVMAAVDLSPVSPGVLEHAFAMAEGGVHVVSIFDEPVSIPGDHPESLRIYSVPSEVRRVDEQREAVRILAEATAPENARYEVTVSPGAPAHLEILDIARALDPDLVVLGASGRRTWSKALFGSNAARIISGGHFPVLVVPDIEERRKALKGRSLSDAAPEAYREQIVFGAFGPREVAGAVTRLVDAGIEADHLSVVMSPESHERLRPEDPSDEGFVAGSVVGTSAGGILGGLASLGVASGVGVVVMGPAVALGLIGGLIGALVSHGVPEHDAARLQDLVDRGQTLVAVHAYSPEELERAKTSLADAGAHPRRLFV